MRLPYFATLSALARLPQPNARDQPAGQFCRKGPDTDDAGFIDDERCGCAPEAMSRPAAVCTMRGEDVSGTVEDARDDRAGQVAGTGRGIAALDCERAQPRAGLAAGPH